MSTELSRPRSVRLASIAGLLLICVASLTAAPGGADEPRIPGPHPTIGSVGDLLLLEIPEDEGFRVVAISQAVAYALFASPEVRATVFEGVRPELLRGGGSALGLTLPASTLVEAYAAAPSTSGLAGAFRAALDDTGLLSPDALTEGGLRRVLITMIRSNDPGAMYDFSMSEQLQSVTTREEDLRAGRGKTTTETNALLFMEADHPTRALFDTWRFDALPDMIEQGEARQELEDGVLQARRAGLRLEAVNALYLADPAYETAVIDWIEAGLSQADINRLAQLLQIAGFEQITAQVLVTQSAPHLFDPSILVAKLFQRFELLTDPVGTRGLRRLQRARFRDQATLDRAEVFYSQFFVPAGKRRLRFELTAEVQEFIRRLSAEVRELSEPHLTHLLGIDFDLGTESAGLGSIAGEAKS